MAELPLSDRHETVLAPAPDAARLALDRALHDTSEGPERKAAISAVVADHPTFLAAWAALAPLGDSPVERYAYARVGYHRGLDALRGSGWGGRGYVRWSQVTNRGFLTCLVQLRRAAAEIGEVGEVERIGGFLSELDPDWDETNVGW